MFFAGAGADDANYASGASQLGALPRYVRDWATGDSASASGGRRWPIDSLEHALELELDIQEADMRLVCNLSVVLRESQRVHSLATKQEWLQGFYIRKRCTHI